MDKVINFVLKETSKEFYGISNVNCPICDSKLDVLPISIVRLGNVGFCLSCYTDIPNNN